jgi:hypothetical protein
VFETVITIAFQSIFSFEMHQIFFLNLFLTSAHQNDKKAKNNFEQKKIELFENNVLNTPSSLGFLF